MKFHLPFLNLKAAAEVSCAVAAALISIQSFATSNPAVQEYARRFREKNGTIVCRELLKDVPVTPGDTPEKRTPEFYARRPCLRLAGEAAAILDEMLAEYR